MVGHHFHSSYVAEYGSAGYGCQSCSWSHEFSMPPRSRLRIWSRERGSAVPSWVSPLILHLHAESGPYSRAPLLPLAFRDYDGVHVYRRPPSGHSRNFMRSRSGVLMRVRRHGASSSQIRSSNGCYLLSLPHVPNAARANITAFTHRGHHRRGDVCSF